GKARGKEWEIPKDPEGVQYETNKTRNDCERKCNGLDMLSRLRVQGSGARLTKVPPQQCTEIPVLVRLGEEFRRAEFLGFIDLRTLGGSRVNDDGDVAENPALFHCRQEFETIHPWHVKIQ